MLVYFSLCEATCIYYLFDLFTFWKSLFSVNVATQKVKKLRNTKKLKSILSWYFYDFTNPFQKALPSSSAYIQTCFYKSMYKRPASHPVTINIIEFIPRIKYIHYVKYDIEERTEYLLDINFMGIICYVQDHHKIYMFFFFFFCGKEMRLEVSILITVPCYYIKSKFWPERIFSSGIRRILGRIVIAKDQSVYIAAQYFINFTHMIEGCLMFNDIVALYVLCV